eukprot:TRINITY_DN8257_c0_g1_i1.p1 TRINITY_DN8257_c0_g1~~TRINITY_DN8257_c0_g1_i1.p1  ORF type:complete len:598 (+),score=65.13 TRINITY_DN8257_c0_g1_i1:37-1794(+)
MNILDLPEEIQLYCYSFLDLPQLHVACCVCTAFARICKDSSLDWSNKFLVMAQTEMDKQAYFLAISILNRLLKHDPTCAVGLKQRGLCWEHKEEPERAIEDFRKAVEYAVTDAQRHRFRSYLYLSLRDYNAAYDEVNRALELSPNDPTNFHQHAYVLFKLSNSLGRSSQKEEMEDYARVLQLGYDRLTVIYNNIGYVDCEQGLFPEALENFNKSIELCPHHVRAYYNRSTVWEELRDWNRAIQDYNTILSINPEVYDAYFFRSKCHARMSNWNEAIKDCLFSLQHNRAHAPSLNHLYSLLLENGNVDLLFTKLSKLERLCKGEYRLLQTLISDPKPDMDALKKTYSRYSHIFSYGPTKREIELAKFSQILHTIYIYRGQIRLLNGDLADAESDLAEVKLFSTEDVMDNFFFHSMEELDLENIRSETLIIGKELFQSCYTRRNLRIFISVLDSKISQSGENCILSTTADQLYFLACYAFRRLRLHRSYSSDDSVVSFWQLLKKKDPLYEALQFACSDPLILTSLFDAFLGNILLFTAPFLASFQEPFSAHVTCESEVTPDGKKNFFQACRQLLLSHANQPARGNGD